FLGIYLLWKMKNKYLIVWYVVGGIIAGAILIAYNILAYGEPFFISYQAYAIVEKSVFPEHKKGFLGITYPRLHLLWKLAFPPQRGLFFYNPVLLAIFPGALLFWLNKKYRAELLLIIAIIVSHFCFNASYGDTMTSWGGGGTTGPRHLIPMIPFAMILLSLVFQKMKPVFLVLLLPSFIFMLIATAVNPVLGFEKNPMFEYAIPRFVKGELAVNQYGTFNNTFITKNSVAFNPGKLLGLQGTLSLLPLAIIWLILGGRLTANWVSAHLIQPEVRRLLLGSVILLLGIIILLPYYFNHYHYKVLINPYHSGLIGYYYEGANWEGNPVFIRQDAEIDFPWGYKKQPLFAPFSVEWKGYLNVPEDGVYTFLLESDDGSQLYINDELIIDNSGIHLAVAKEGKCNLKKGKHKILVRYFNKVGNSIVRLYWIKGSQKEIIPRKYLSSR
ncbi:MAG: PA14 domain-containing protein, partial [Candidatus Sumerlaeia bacterium]|nr:PA14 domain-containing protein [Candidatus Sumerlaeia bacterium]